MRVNSHYKDFLFLVTVAIFGMEFELIGYILEWGLSKNYS